MAAYEESVPQSHRPLMGHRGDRTSKEQRAVVESIREATGASVEDIKFQLDECGGDINKATELLITEPFTVVQSRKSKARSTIRERGRGTTARRGRPEENERRGRGRGRGLSAPRRRGGSRTKYGKEPPEHNKIETEEVKIEEEKVKPLVPKFPVHRGYREALCGPPKVKSLQKELEADPCLQKSKEKESGFLVQKDDIEFGGGWEPAAFQPENLVPAFHGHEDIASESSNKEDSAVATQPSYSKEEAKSWADEVEDDEMATQESREAILPPSNTDTFPISMGDIRFTREPLTPVVPSMLPMTLKMETCWLPTLNDEEDVDVSNIRFHFGTFEGIHPLRSQIKTPSDVPDQKEEEDDLLPLNRDTNIIERLEAASLMDPVVEDPPQTMQSENSMAFMNVSDGQALSLEEFSRSVDLSLDPLVSDVGVSQPAETTFVPPVPVGEEDPRPVRLIVSEGSLPEKPFGSLPSEDPHTLPSLDRSSDYVNLYQTGLANSEPKKSEEVTSFELPESRSAHRQPAPTLPESNPVIEPDTSFMSPGSAQTLNTYQQPRHPSHHKLPDKPPAPVGTGVPSHHNPKYNSHPGSNVVPNPNSTVHVSGSLNPNSSVNPSLPTMQQVSFLNHGIVPNPAAIPFPPGHPYYPQFMQYQHQMFHHGMYAGGYGGFGAPVHHDSVGHPSHGNPVGVPPNQGNTVYDTSNAGTFSNNKDKDNVFLNQQQLPIAGFPGPPPHVARNDPSMFYVPNQTFTQGFRNQFHQPPGFAGQFHGGGFVAPAHTFHPPGQQGSNFRFN